MYPSSDICQHFQNSSLMKRWSRFLLYFTYSIYRQKEFIIMPFCFNRIGTLVAMVTYSCHWLIMGKWKLSFIAVSMQVSQKCSLSSPLGYTWILSKRLNLICCHGNQNVKFAKNIKILKAVRGRKLKLSRNVAATKIVSLITSAHVLSSLWQLKVSKGLKWEKWK